MTYGLLTGLGVPVPLRSRLYCDVKTRVGNDVEGSTRSAIHGLGGGADRSILTGHGDDLIFFADNLECDHDGVVRHPLFYQVISAVEVVGYFYRNPIVGYGGDLVALVRFYRESRRASFCHLQVFGRYRAVASGYRREYL